MFSASAQAQNDSIEASRAMSGTFTNESSSTSGPPTANISKVKYRGATRTAIRTFAPDSIFFGGVAQIVHPGQLGAGNTEPPGPRTQAERELGVADLFAVGQRDGVRPGRCPAGAG